MKKWSLSLFLLKMESLFLVTKMESVPIFHYECHLISSFFLINMIRSLFSDHKESNPKKGSKL
ncbi:hypothetical protein RJ60_11400 [Mesotoga sp. B105.6.4]|nr:hypothetical protein RJ60_11400 [Mesotoga sp. B105.6.4]